MAIGGHTKGKLIFPMAMIILHLITLFQMEQIELVIFCQSQPAFTRWAAFFASAALWLCVFSGGARRRIRRRSLSSAALALVVVFPLLKDTGT